MFRDFFIFVCLLACFFFCVCNLSFLFFVLNEQNRIEFNYRTQYNELSKYQHQHHHDHNRHTCYLLQLPILHIKKKGFNFAPFKCNTGNSFGGAILHPKKLICTFTVQLATYCTLKGAELSCTL